MTSALDLLRYLAAENYQPRKVPAAHDAAIAAELGKVDSTESLVALAADVDQGIARVLNSFAFRMATLALRRRDSAWIRYGLVAAQLAMAAEDDREVLPTYALLYRSAELIGSNAAALFRQTSFIPEHPMRETPAEFADRTPGDRAIESMGFRLVDAPDGQAFRPIGRSS